MTRLISLSIAVTLTASLSSGCGSGVSASTAGTPHGESFIYVILDPTVPQLDQQNAVLTSLVPQKKKNQIEGGIPEDSTLVVWVLGRDMIAGTGPTATKFPRDLQAVNGSGHAAAVDKK